MSATTQLIQLLHDKDSTHKEVQCMLRWEQSAPPLMSLKGQRLRKTRISKDRWRQEWCCVVKKRNKGLVGERVWENPDIEGSMDAKAAQDCSLWKANMWWQQFGLLIKLLLAWASSKHTDVKLMKILTVPHRWQRRIKCTHLHETPYTYTLQAPLMEACICSDLWIHLASWIQDAGWCIIVKTFYMQMELCLWWLCYLRLFGGCLIFLYVCVYAGMRQRNDRGTQYRSAIYTSTPAQQELALKSKLAFQQV